MSDRPKHQHGRTEYFIEGEGVASAAMPSPRLQLLLPNVAKALDATRPAVDPNRAFPFCRLLGLPEFRPDDAGLIALGQALEDTAAQAVGNAIIPAGFTYFGQFVDHDITFDRTEGIPSGALDPAEIVQGRSPALDLDSVYIRGPTNSPELYEADKLHLRLGTTTGRALFGITQSLPNDLPRLPATDPKPRQAVIGDPRNDENLIVAQTHLAFLKLHNKVLDQLQAAGTPPAQLFDETRKTVVQHYQSIVLHDFVKRLVDPAVYDDVLKYGRKFYFPKGAPVGKRLCMPIEFSVAAYRLGHSMIRNEYDWNLVFSNGGKANFSPGLNLAFLFSAVSGNLGGEPTLPTDWVVDWRRMFDFSEQPGGVRHPQQNFTRLIDTNLARDLKILPEFALAPEPHLKFLAVRNLLRGRLVGLPTGQDVAAKLGVPALPPTKVADGPHSAIILSNDFDTKTPLWFYILKEAEVNHGGLHLGAVGSRLVVETFHGLVEGSIHSILKQPNWKPTLGPNPGDRFTMNELLLFVDDINPLSKLDPLGDF
jgi:hypothetical protein